MSGAVLLDGSLIPTQRRTGLPTKRRWSAKHKRHGLLVIALTDVKGRLLWTSTARPARSSEITSCRHDDRVGRLPEAGLAAIADLGFVGLDDGGDETRDPSVITGYNKPKGKKLPPPKRLVNQLIATERAVCEHAFAHLKNWRVLTRLRLDVKWATRLVRALMISTSTRSTADRRSSPQTPAADRHRYDIIHPRHPCDLHVQDERNSMKSFSVATGRVTGIDARSVRGSRAVGGGVRSLNPQVQEPRWFRILPHSTCPTRWSSAAPCCRHDTLAQLSARFGISVGTAHAYTTAVVDLLADRAPGLLRALREANPDYVLLDGTLAECDRVGDSRADFSHEHRRHGVNVQVVTDPVGQLLWISPMLPGRAHDLTTARTLMPGRRREK